MNYFPEAYWTGIIDALAPSILGEELMLFVVGIAKKIQKMKIKEKESSNQTKFNGFLVQNASQMKYQ